MAVPALDAVLNDLPEGQRHAVVEILQASESHSGPLPTPGQLGDYDAVLPGLAERIVRLTEIEQQHRHAIVKLAMQRDARLKERGQALGMAALILVLGFCAYLVAAGAPAIAGTVATGLIVAVVGIFVTGRRADLKAHELDLADD